MIQAVMFITLGFLVASLIGILIAPLLWSRAYRLSRKRLESALPLSLSEIEATQDQLRAFYAVRMRRLETALAGTKQKAALQLVDNSRLQMQIVTLRDNVAELELKLSERRNAAGVLEQTVTKRVPELEGEILALRAQLQERIYELRDITNRLARKDETLEQVERAASLYQDEMNKLRQAFEKTGADKTGRRLRKPSKWDIDDFRAEYDRLNLDLSKMRQQLSLYQERDTQQVGLIKGEMQKLAELILVSSQPKPQPPAPQAPEPVIARRLGGPDLRRDRPVPWPERGSRQPSPADDKGQAVNISLSEVQQTPESPSLGGVSRNSGPENFASLQMSAGAVQDALGKPRGENGIADRLEKPETLSARSKVEVSPKSETAPAASQSKSRLFLDVTSRDDPKPPPTVDTGLNGMARDSEMLAPESVTQQGPTDPLPEGQRTADANRVSEKAFSDARELNALSELMAINPGGTAEKGRSAEVPSAIAAEAQKGQVLDLTVSPAPDGVVEAKASNSQSQLRTLLDRLRTLDDEPVEAKK